MLLELKYKSLKIGELKTTACGWEFCYALAFINQDEIDPITDFPVKNKTYNSTRLWPFFLSRIPSLATPRVKRKVIEESVNPRNQAEMLMLFGKRSINNPFVLEVRKEQSC